MGILPSAICLSLVIGTALALPFDGSIPPAGLGAVEEDYKSLQTVFRRLINTVVSRDSEQLKPKLKRLLHSELTPAETQELVVDILNGVKEELLVSKVDLEEEIKAAEAKGDEDVTSLLTAEMEALDRVVKKTHIAVRMASSVSQEILVKMTDKFKPLLAGILEANQKDVDEHGAEGENGNEVSEQSIGTGVEAAEETKK